jgi:hypothetical protein
MAVDWTKVKWSFKSSNLKFWFLLGETEVNRGILPRQSTGYLSRTDFFFLLVGVHKMKMEVEGQRGRGRPSKKKWINNINEDLREKKLLTLRVQGHQTNAVILIPASAARCTTRIAFSGALINSSYVHVVARNSWQATRYKIDMTGDNWQETSTPLERD